MKMKKTIELTKILLKNTNNQFIMKNKTKRAKIGIWAIVIYVAVVFGYISNNVIELLLDINQPAIFLGILFIAISGLTIVQTIITSINIFYMSKDIEYLLPMPITSKELLMAKFNTLLITEYIVEFIFTLVPIIFYGMLTSANIVFYIYAFLVLILFPVLPAAIATLVVIIIMSFSKNTKNKDRFSIIATIISLVLVLSVQFISMPEIEMTEEQMTENFMQVNGMIDVVAKYFITIKPSIETLSNHTQIYGLYSFLKLFIITVVSYILFIILGNKLYLKGAVRKCFKYRKCKREIYKW